MAKAKKRRKLAIATMQSMQVLDFVAKKSGGSEADEAAAMDAEMARAREMDDDFN